MSKVRVCFLGTPEFAVVSLKALLEDEHYEVVGVVTQPDRPAGRKLQLTPSPVKSLALAHGLRVLSPESLKSNPLMLDEIRKWGAEIAVVVAFGQILNQEFLDSFHRGCVNVHGSLLPRWRGAAPIQRAIQAGDKITGVALQKIVKKLDAGDVIGSRAVSLDDEINAQQLHDQLALLGADLLRVELMDYVRGNLAGAPQDEAKVTIARKIEKSEAELDWSQSAQDLHNKVRAFVMGPGTYTMFEGKRVKIHRTRVAPAGSSGRAPGALARSGEGSLRVVCGRDEIEILELQPDSGKRMSAAEFLRGVSLTEASRFGRTS